MTMSTRQIRRLEDRLAALEAATGTTKPFPVGSIYETVIDQNPNALLGYGTWSLFGVGQMTVGVDTGDTDFDTVEKTGGTKRTGSTSYAEGEGVNVAVGLTAAINANHAHDLLPYITVYRWKRTA